MLEPLGLSPVEEAIYRQIVDRPSGEVPEIARGLGLDPADVSGALIRLSSVGLVSRSTAGPGHYVPAPPGVVLGQALADRQQDLKRAEIAVHDLIDRYRESAQGRFVTDVVDIVTGAEAVTTRLAQMQRQARTEVIALVRAGVLAMTAEENTEEDAALRRGVRYRVIVEQDVVRSNPNFYDQALEARSYGEEIRVATTLPVRMLMVDREFALIPLSKNAPQDSPAIGALLVHPGALLDALEALHDLLWARSAPIAGEDSETTSALAPLDRRILELLLSGLTDRATGSQLGLSLRTVQRRVGQLMERAGVVTRIQLGAEAQRQGWLGTR